MLRLDQNAAHQVPPATDRLIDEGVGRSEAKAHFPSLRRMSPRPAAIRSASTAAGSIVAAAVITARTSSSDITDRCCVFDDFNRAIPATFVAHPSPPLGLRQRSAQHSMQVLDADAASHAIQRAVDLLDEEHDEAVTETFGTTEAPVRWKHTFHSLRHLYVSQSLAPVDAGGLGWSLPFVQRCVGHSSSTITESVYGHIVRDEFEVARAVHHAWPGL